MPDRNLLDELMKLLNQPGPINWALASQVADHLSGPPVPVDPWVAEEYMELARFALRQLPQVTGIPVEPTIDVVPVDRIGWTKRNLRAFDYLVEPLGAELGVGSVGAGPLDSILKPLGPALLGMQIGALVGGMSEEVLGRFDTGLPATDPVGVYVLLSNLETFSASNGLDTRQVRLWSALHEVVHHTLVGRPWVRSHLTDLGKEAVGSIEFDTSSMADWYEDLADPAKLEEKLIDGGGLTGLLGKPISDENLAPLRTLIATLEGYGSYLVERASESLLPDLDSIRIAMSSHNRKGAGHLSLGGLFTVDSAAGLSSPTTAFCAEVHARWGDVAVHRIWERPENLPHPTELGDTTGWAARVLLDDPFA